MNEQEYVEEIEILKKENAFLKAKIDRWEKVDVRARVALSAANEVFLYFFNKGVHADFIFDPEEPDEIVLLLNNRKEDTYKVVTLNSFEQLAETLQIVFKAVKTEQPLFKELEKFDSNVSKYKQDQ